MKSRKIKLSNRKRKSKYRSRKKSIRIKLKKILYDGSNGGIYKCEGCEECENGYCKRCSECRKRQVTINEKENVTHFYDKSTDKSVVIKKIQKFYELLKNKKKLIVDRKTILLLLNGNIHFDEVDKKNDLFGEFYKGIETMNVIKGKDDYDNILNYIENFLEKK